MHERSAAFVGWVLSIAAATSASCADESASFVWRATFEDEANASRAAGYEASITRGGCTAANAVYEARFRAGEAAADAPRRLQKGRYGFRVRALDATCATIAEGCEERDVPLGDASEVHVTMRATATAARCEASACTMGVCASPPRDGGATDATADGTIDAGLDDGGATDAMRDADALDARTPCPDGGCTRIVVRDVVRVFDGGAGTLEEQHRFAAGVIPAGYTVALDEAFFGYALPCPADTFELLVAASATAGASDWVYTVFPQERDALVDAGFRTEASFVCVGSPQVPPPATVVMRRYVNVRVRHGSYRFVRDDRATERAAAQDAGFTEDVTDTFVVWTAP